jgi:hypothetical protein
MKTGKHEVGGQPRPQQGLGKVAAQLGGGARRGSPFTKDKSDFCFQMEKHYFLHAELECH